MKRGKRPELLWGLGLSDTEQAQIKSAVGPGFFLRNMAAGSMPKARAGGESRPEQPTVTWIPWRVWSGMHPAKKEAFQEWEDTQRVLIQDESDEPVDLERVLEQGFLTVVRQPLTKDKVQDALFRAKEVRSLYGDIYRMTEEIFMERELLARKTDQLLFLNKVLTRATEDLDSSSILAKAAEDLSMLMPVKHLMAVSWQAPEGQEFVEADFHFQNKLAADEQDQWIEFMMQSAAKLSGKPVQTYQVRIGAEGKRAKALDKGHGPKAGQVVVLPLKAGGNNFGCLVILLEKVVRLGKDQIQTLNAAVNHLALALKNALTFHQVKYRAVRDGLTRIYNRQAFDERLVEEMKRYQRYRHDLSLLMMDLDHFKKINDTYGHEAGDQVLRQTAKVLLNSLRSTDFAARYGGEEFVVLLPHTAEDKAWKLAERIRKDIAKERFSHNGDRITATASIGVASITAGTLNKENNLLAKADEALYLAKRSGRNIVVVSNRSKKNVVGS